MTHNPETIRARTLKYLAGAVCGTALALIGSTGCSQRADLQMDLQEVDLAKSQDSLSSTSEQCGTAAAAATITGTGKVRSSTSYNPSQCYRAYLVDVNNYAPGELGGLVSYGSTAPETEEECTRTSLRTYVWRREVNGTATFIDNIIRKGAWVDDGLGGKRCATPNVDLNDSLPSVTRGGSYRFAVRASVLPPAGSTVAEVYKSVYIDVTPASPVHTADAIFTQAARYAAAIPGPGGAIDPVVSKVFAIRDYPAAARDRTCRLWKVQLTLMRQNAFSLKRIVPSDQGAVVDRRTTSGELMRSLVCDPLPAGTTTVSALQTLQAAVKDHLASLGNIQQSAMRELNVTSSDAAELIAQSTMLDLHRTARGCGAVPAEVNAFLTTGSVPSGMPGADVLVRNCTGSTNAIVGSLGIGADTGGDRRTKYRQCVDAQAAQFTDRCAGPLVQSDPSNPDPSAPPAPDGSKPCAPGQDLDIDSGQCVASPSSDPITVQQVQTFVQAGEDYEESVRRANTADKIAAVEGVIGGTLSLLGGLAAWSGASAGVVAAAAVPGGILVVVAAVAVAVAVDARADASDARDQACAIDRTACKDLNNRCAEFDLAGNRAWFQTDPNPFHPDGHQTTKADQIDDCICQLFDRDYGKVAGDFLFGGPSGWCPSDRERQIQECLRNPEGLGPDDKPTLKPECLALLQPKEVDRDSLATRWCKYKMPNCTGAFLEDDGTCGCPEVVAGMPGTGTKPTCPNINVTDCLPDGMLDEKTCLCTPLDGGLGCSGGGLSGYLAKNPGDVFLATFPQETAVRGKNYLMFAPGNTPVTTRKMLDAKLTALASVKVAARLPTPTGSSGFQGWAVQLSCTNEGANVQNRNLGTAQLQNLAPGAVTLTFPLTAADRTACFNGTQTPVRFEIRSNNQSGQPRLGFQDLSVTNLIDDLPTLPDPCKTPQPPAPGPDPLPIQPVPFDSLFAQGLWRFSDGVLVTNPVLR